MFALVSSTNEIRLPSCLRVQHRRPGSRAATWTEVSWDFVNSLHEQSSCKKCYDNLASTKDTSSTCEKNSNDASLTFVQIVLTSRRILCMSSLAMLMLIPLLYMKKRRCLNPLKILSLDTCTGNVMLMETNSSKSEQKSPKIIQK